MWNLKKDTNERTCRTETDTYPLEKNIRGTCGAGMNGGFGIGLSILLYMEGLANRKLLYSTGNSIQYFIVVYMGKESVKEWICVNI